MSCKNEVTKFCIVYDSLNRARMLRYTRMKEWQVCFCMLSLTKIFKKIFTFILNKIAASVWYCVFDANRLTLWVKLLVAAREKK